MPDRIYVVAFRNAPVWFLKKLDQAVLNVGQTAETDRALSEGMHFQITVCSSEEEVAALYAPKAGRSRSNSTGTDASE